MCKPHAAQHVRCLAELDVVVGDNLYAVTPGIEKIEKTARQSLNADFYQCLAHCFFVIDHKPEMATLVRRLRAPFLKGKELIAQVDEGGCSALATKLEIEHAAIESQRLFDITNLKGDMVEADSARFLSLGHGFLSTSCMRRRGQTNRSTPQTLSNYPKTAHFPRAVQQAQKRHDRKC